MTNPCVTNWFLGHECHVAGWKKAQSGVLGGAVPNTVDVVVLTSWETSMAI